MSIAQVTNPFGVNERITDFQTGVGGAGNEYENRNIKWPFRANATITKGQALMTVAPTATVPLSVTPMTAAAADALFAGVAAEAAAAGDQVEVVVFGYTLALLEAADTPATGNVLSVPDTTTGRLATDTTALKSTVGVQVGPETGSGTDLAICFIGPVPRLDTIV